MSEDLGALSGSREPDPSCTGSGPSGFDPARLSALSFVLPFDDGGERLSVSHDERNEHWGEHVVIRQNESDDSVIYVRLADLNWLIGALKLAAIATEARRAETPQSGSVHEGAGRKASPKPSQGDTK
jgi:hypothetical protein